MYFMEINNTPAHMQEEGTEIVLDPSRRRFFQLAGGIAGAGLLFAAASCRRTPSSTTFLGEGDVALLNYLYILKQVTSAFYTQAVSTPYFGISKSENELQIDLRDQEMVHREFFKSLLGTNAVKVIATQLSSVTFADKANFLKHAMILEDLSTGAYIGTAKVFKKSEYIMATCKIGTVDARHASYVRDIAGHNALAPTDGSALEPIVAPLAGMVILEKYIETKFDRSKLPTF